MQSFTIDGIIVMPPLIAEYKLDPTIVTHREGLAFEQGYNFEYHNFMYNVKDVSINKYSSFTLTDKTNVVDNFDIREIPFEYPVNNTTYLCFNSSESDPFTGLSAVSASCLTSVSATTALSAVSGNNNTEATYLTITDEVTLDSDNDSIRLLSAEKFLSRRTEPSLPQKFYFNIMFINAIDCYIYHLENDTRWYLSQKDEVGEILKFIKIDHEQGFEDLLDQIEKDGGDKIKFQYNKLPNNLLRIYKKYNDTTHVLKMLTPEEVQNSPESNPIRLEQVIDPDNDGVSDESNLTVNELTEYSTVRVRGPYQRKTYKRLIPTVNNYETSISNNNLDVSDKSISHHTNMLVHSEYYYLTGESIPINFYSLKNDQTSEGITTGNELDPREHSIYSNRTYNKIETGTNQLEGTSNISLEYSTGSHTYEFKPGLNYFNTPQDLGIYNKININDTTIVSSGSIAGSNPAQSDKIFKQQKANDLYSLTTKWGKSHEEQLGTWLCTWLSGGDDPTRKPVWVDRYYNPSKLGYVDALIEITDYVHNKYITSNLDVFESEDGVVTDLPSRLTLEPGMSYAYHRLNETDIKNNLSILDPHHIQRGIDNYKTISNKPGTVTNDEYIFDGNYIGELVSGQKLQDIEQFAISYDIDLHNFKEVQNHQLIGNYTSSGLGFFQRNDVSPFMFLLGADGKEVNNQKQNTSIRIYNNDFELYNYITNDNFLTDDQQPGLFHTVVTRELPENIFAITTTGSILELTHDGIVLSSYNEWFDKFASKHETEHGFLPVLKSVCWDERYIYILSHTGFTKKDYKIHTFDMVSKLITELDESCKVFTVPVPSEFTSTSSLKSRGRTLGHDTPPNQINISDGTGAYSQVRTLYLTTGDISKNSARFIWTLVKGSSDPISSLQVNHDAIYCFDKSKLQLLTGLLTDNNLLDSSLPLSIIDYAIDSEEKLWVIHGENKLSTYTYTRKLLSTTELENQQAVSLVITRDFDDTAPGKIVDRCCVLTNTAGTDVMQLQIGPTNHPTNDKSSPNFRMASPWISGGNIYDRSRFTNTNSVIYDDLSGHDESTQVIYPFVDGAERFGSQTFEIGLMDGDDPGGRVLDGDYELVTEGFDFIVNESVNILNGNIFDTTTLKLIEQVELTDLVVDDVSNLPQLLNHYEYSVLNFQRYSKNNFNCKLNLEPLFKKFNPDKINFKIDLDDVNLHPYTGYFNITLNINNTKGLVEMWVNGQLHSDHMFKFDPNKYRFTNILNKKLIIGTTPFLNDTLLYAKLNSTQKYIVRDVKIRNINMYTKCLEYHEILNIMRRYQPLSSMSWSVPTKRKNYIDVVEKMFNHSIPPRKSNSFDIVIRNSSIRSIQLQNYISNKVRENLVKITPAGTFARAITWSNELLDFTDPEQDGIDYNPIADEIIVDPSGITLPAYIPYVLQ
jgi:hypothetical protein